MEKKLKILENLIIECYHDSNMNAIQPNDNKNTSLSAAEFYYERKSEFENLFLRNVSDQREQLIDFFRKVSKVRLEDKGNMYTVTKAVDDYLKDN